MARFRILRGRHIEGGKTYTKNQVFESKSDLLLQNGPGSLKFELVPDKAVPTLDDEDEDSDGPDLHKMTKAQLQTLLEEKGVEYDSTDTKAELIARLEDAAANE